MSLDECKAKYDGLLDMGGPQLLDMYGRLRAG